MTVDVESLQRAGAAIRRARWAAIPAPESWALELRARFDPTALEALEVLAGARSPIASTGRYRGRVMGHNSDAATAPFCGDCGAIRSPSGDCSACGSSQPANLSRLNPRARHMIGEAPLR